MLDFLKITDIRSEQIAIGKQLLTNMKLKYPKERVLWMRKTLEDLATETLKNDISLDDLFYLCIYDYWVYGNTVSEEIYFHFPYKKHEEKKKYITFRTRLLLMRQINDFKESYLLNNKYETYKKFKQYYFRDIIKIESENDYDKFECFVKKHHQFVVKPTSSHIGIGVEKMKITDKDDLKKLFNKFLKQGQMNAKDCFDFDTSFLVEELIEQDERLSSFHPYSVNPVRITTFKRGSEIKLLYPWFKIGANKAFITSAAFGTYDAGIDVETGVVITDGFKENGMSDITHPLSGIQFKGFQIPEWQSLIEIAKRLAGSLPNVNYVGWDMVLTPKGWSIMEGNFTGDFMWQMFNQKGFRKEFENLTGIQMDKDFWWQS